MPACTRGKNDNDVDNEVDKTTRIESKLQIVLCLHVAFKTCSISSVSLSLYVYVCAKKEEEKRRNAVDLSPPCDAYAFMLLNVPARMLPPHCAINSLVI